MATEAQTQPVDMLLLTTIQERLGGKIDDASLAAMLQQSSPGIEAMETEFLEACESVPPEVRDRVQILIESGQGLFEQARITLVWVRDFLEFGELDLLFSAADTLARCRFQLDLLFRKLKDTTWTLQGPTNIANLNALYWAYEFYRNDPRKGLALRELAEAERRAMPQAVEAIGRGAQTPDILALKNAFALHAESAGRVVAAIDEGRTSDLAREFETLRDSFYRLQAMIPTANYSQRSAGETPSPQVNIVLELTDELAQRKIQDILLMRALDVLYEIFQKTRRYFARLQDQASDSVLLNDEIVRAKSALQFQEAALKRYSDFFETRDLAVLQDARERLKDSAQRLWDCHQGVITIADREGKVVCFRCNHYNPDQRTRCEKCGFMLPKAILETSGLVSTFEAIEGEEDEPIVQGPALTTNLVRLYSAVEQMASGSIEEPYYLDELAWFENLIQKNSTYKREELPDPESLRGKERDAAALKRDRSLEHERLFHEALEEYAEGLAAFRQYPESRSRPDLQEGVRRCTSATAKMVSIRDEPSE